MSRAPDAPSLSSSLPPDPPAGPDDLTPERVREEYARYKSLSQRLQVILQGVADGITVQDSAGRFLFANLAAARVCGFDSVDQLLATPPDEVAARFELLDERGLPVERASLPNHQVLRGTSSASHAVHVRERATGRNWWMVIRSTLVTDHQGAPALAVSIWHDVTADRRREEQERYISGASAVLASSLDYAEVLRSLAGLLVPGLGDYCAIHMLEGERLVDTVVAHGDAEKQRAAQSFSEKYRPVESQPRGVLNVLRTGVSELYETLPDALLAAHATSAEHLQALREVGLQSLLMAPIRVRDRVLGVLTLASAASGRRYDHFDLELAEELGRRVGTTIEHARLYAAERSARGRLELIARAGEIFASSLDYELTLRNIVDITLPVLADFAFFDVVEGQRVRRVAKAHADTEIDGMIRQTEWSRSERQDKNLCALSSGHSGFHPYIDDAWRVDVALSPGHLELLRRLQLGSMITVPMRGRGELLGSLTLCFGKSGRHHSIEDLHTAEELARRAGVSIVQARLFARLEAAAKAAEEAAAAAEAASRVKDEFLATVSHELRTPLNAILGWATLLRQRELAPDVGKGVEVIQRNAQAQAKLIDDILDVSRIITGKLRLELEPTDLLGIVRDAIEVVRPSASAKHIEIEVSAPAEPCVLVADPARMQQVVWNLLSNAVKFTEARGAIRIAIVPEQARLRVTVSDTGQGIAPEFLPFVFDRFKQADGSTTRRIGGLGLGLAIVRHIVELHGGEVHAHSAGLGRGASFTLSLPQHAVVPAAVTPSLGGTAAQHPPAPRLHGVRVLVVDDEPDARDLLELLLQAAGSRVQKTASAAEALACLPTFRPDVIVSDIGMPFEDGHSLLRRVRELPAAQGGGVPAIALTAYARSEDKSKALAAGFTMHMGKPVDPEELLAAVANLARLRSWH